MFDEHYAALESFFEIGFMHQIIWDASRHREKQPSPFFVISLDFHYLWIRYLRFCMTEHKNVVFLLVSALTFRYLCIRFY